MHLTECGSPALRGSGRAATVPRVGASRADSGAREKMAELLGRVGRGRREGGARFLAPSSRCPYTETTSRALTGSRDGTRLQRRLDFGRSLGVPRCVDADSLLPLCFRRESVRLGGPEIFPKFLNTYRRKVGRQTDGRQWSAVEDQISQRTT